MPLSSTDLSACHTAFEIFDKDRDGKCSRRELGYLMRAVGQTPSEADLAAIYEKYNLEDDSSVVDQALFIKIMDFEAKPKNPNEAADLRDQFRVFDRNDDGTIGVSEFKYVMTNLGEKMSDDEVNELLNFQADLVDPKTGLIKYDVMIKILLA